MTVTEQMQRPLADVSGAQQQLVAGDFGLGRILAQCRDEKLAPKHRFLMGSANSSMLKLVSRLLCRPVAHRR